MFFIGLLRDMCIIGHSIYYRYADNLILFSVGDTLADASLCLQKDTDKLSSWFNK